MDAKIYKCEVAGTVNVPPSKSYTQRAYAAALLAGGESVINNPSFCEDSKAALSIIEKFGARYSILKNSIKIIGCKPKYSGTLNCMESGLAMRMFAPIAALCNKEITLTGKPALLKRPVPELERVLNELGAFCATNEKYPPVKIKGPINSGRVELDGSFGSQFLTGLLMALPIAGGDSEITVRNLKSRPYIDMTIELLEKFRIIIINENYERFILKGNAAYLPAEINIEADWSSAAFLCVAGAISGQLTLMNMNPGSKQADKRIIDALKNAGAIVSVSNNSIEIKKSELKSFEFDARDCPDLFPVLAVLASYCNGKSIITGTDRLIHKESNRAEALKSELSAIGVNISLSENKMIIKGGKIRGGTVNSHGDHRIAMAMAIAALNADEPILIKGAECVNKSFPGFFELLKQITKSDYIGLYL